MPAALLRDLATLALAVLLLAAMAHAEPFAVIEGQVEVRRQGLFGAPADRSGVIVYLTGFQRPPPAHAEQLTQEGEQFHPRILPVVAGQTVAFPNRDRIYHNVFSISPVHAFDLGQYRGADPTKRERFDRPGLVPVYCNIHPRMIAYVAVLENDAFATSDRDGRFRIERVPPGRHTLHAFTPGAERTSRAVDVAAGQTLSLALSLEVGRIAPHRRKDGSPYPRPGSDLER